MVRREWKEPAENIKEDEKHAYQLRRYTWSAKLPLSVLTDFQEFAVYDCRIKPEESDKASTARVMFFTCDDLVDKWEEFAASPPPSLPRQSAVGNQIQLACRLSPATRPDEPGGGERNDGFNGWLLNSAPAGQARPVASHRSHRASKGARRFLTMGFIIHYSLSANCQAATQARRLLVKLRQCALDLPVDPVSAICRPRGTAPRWDDGQEHDPRWLDCIGMVPRAAWVCDLLPRETRVDSGRAATSPHSAAKSESGTS